MRKECSQTSKSLSKYLLGHLFKTEQRKIERHLKKCAFCSTELEALRQAAETKRLLRDITPPEGVVQRVKEGVSGLSRFKKLLYRPLWIAGMIAAGALVYLLLLVPNHALFKQGADDMEQNPAEAPVAENASKTAGRNKNTSARRAIMHDPSVKPLMVTITVSNGSSGRSRINGIMQGHALLRTMRFTDTVKEISGNLTGKELITFFNRASNAGRIRYSRSHFRSFPTAQPIPFVIRLRQAPGRTVTPDAKQAASSTPKAVEKPAEKSQENTPEKPPVETAAPNQEPAE